MGKLYPTLILGGPGCGKTTALLEVIEQAFERGVEPYRIAYVAFTRKAAQEARDRMAAKFGLSPDDLPHFRTLHSFAFKMLDYQPQQILTGSKFEDYATAEALTFNREMVNEKDIVIPQAPAFDEEVLACISLARLKRQSMAEAATDAQLPFEYVMQVRRDLEEFKRESHLVDYTDLIEEFIARVDPPVLDLLIVDEAQDLSRLQWDMVEKLAENAKDVYYAGDDDQAIYAWAGADIEYFLNIKGDKRVLPVSYRLKSRVFEACQAVITDIGHRYAKDWKPHAAGGSVGAIDDLSEIDLTQGTWYFLARDGHTLMPVIDQLHEQGFPYITRFQDGLRSSVEDERVKAVLLWEHMRKGNELPGKDATLVWRLIQPALRGDICQWGAGDMVHMADFRARGLTSEASWLDVIKMSTVMQQHIQAVRARGESLTKTPRITCSTIHGVKGGEADNVVICQQLTPKVYRSYMDGSEHETRVLFTAMSRAKESLLFLSPRTPAHYKLEGIL